MKIREMSISERPREKMQLVGKEGLSNTELMAILVKTGTRGKSAINIAHELLNLGPLGILELNDISIEEIKEVSGIGDAKACEILAAIELGRRISTCQRPESFTIRGVEDVVDMLMEKMRYLKKEFYKVVLLDVKGHVIMIEDVSVGDLSSSVVHPRETFKNAIKRSAASIILVHNHPSGNPEPSSADINVTNRLIDVGELVGIEVLDHIIIGDGVYVSMKQDRIID